MARRIAAVLCLVFAFTLPVYLQQTAPEYDFIIVGGGTSGLVVANRLSENPSISVAVVEEGGSVYNNVNVTTPGGYGLAFGTSIDYAYQSTPQVHAGNKVQTLRAGKALGGSSTINGLVYLRAETSEIDAWQALGNKINWNSLLPYYKKSEGLQIPTEAQMELGASYNPPFHNTRGPVKVGWPNRMVPGDFSHQLNSTYANIGLPWNGDPNAGHMRGYSLYPVTYDRDLDIREDAARAYYYPISGRRNLHAYLFSTVERMTWASVQNGGRPFANGVIYRDQSGAEQHLSARKEVVLSAGALVTPLLLERSGVGNPKILRQFGIETKIPLAHVGENLQDHTVGTSTYSSNINLPGAGTFVAYFNIRDIFGNAASQVAQNVRSSIPSWADQVVAFSGGAVNRTAVERLFNIQQSLIFNDQVAISEVLLSAPAHGTMYFGYWGLLPFSRGSVHITSANPFTQGQINPNYFQFQYDTDLEVATARAVRRTANTQPLKSMLTAETAPGFNLVPADATDEQWANFIKASYHSNYHYIATAAMMSEELGGVVDDNHLVYGSANVRVVDASAMPMQVSGHSTSTLYALAERASDIIKARYS